jgi:aminopeptidase N
VSTVQKEIRLEDYTPSPFLIPETRLNVVVKSEHVEIQSELKIIRNRKINHSGPLTLNGSGLNLKSISKNDKQLDPSEFEITENDLTIFNPDNDFTLTTVVTIDPEKNSQLSGLYASKHGYFTQCEAEGFRRITYFLDRPDILSRFTTVIRAPKERFPVLLSNGNLVHTDDTGETSVVTWADPHPKPCYLFAMVLGRLEKREKIFQTKSGRSVTLQIYAPTNQIGQTEFAMAALERSMKWDEDRFDLEVDLDQYMIVAVDDFNMGAMENKGLNIFNTKYVLADPDISTDRDFMLLDRVVAHEYFHNWTGNRVTCRDWFQLSLKEGLTVFRDQEYGADVYSKGVQRIQEVRNLRTIQFPEDSGPMAHPIRPSAYIEINNFYTATVYEKGAEVVRMIHTLLGEEKFQKGMKLYFDRHDGQAVTTEDFVLAMEDASGIDLKQFRRWYTQAGTPVLEVKDAFDATKQTYTLSFKQHFGHSKYKSNQPVQIPLKLKLFNGNDLGQDEVLVNLTKSEEEFSFDNISQRPTPSFLRDFSAPIILEYNYDNEDLYFLLANDDNAFSRWEAAQKLQSRLVLDLYKQGKCDQNFKFDPSFISALETSFNDKEIDDAFKSELFATPSEIELAELFDFLDPIQLHWARNTLREHIAESLEPHFLDQYHKLVDAELYSPDHHSAGVRALKNVCLNFLCTSNKKDHSRLAFEQFMRATNMTARLGALQALAYSDSPKRNEAIDLFYERWQTEPLAVDKWLSIQAASSKGDVPKVVQSLMQHEAFDIKNPNKVFSLLRTFASNHVHFHNEDGVGYQLISDAIIQLDEINPQVAARLSRSFDSWRKFDSVRQSHARKSMEAILNKPHLSKDTGEIISKTLNN